MMRIAAALAVLALLQDSPQEEVVAIVGAKILTVTQGEIASGTIVIKGGKIAEIGAAVTPPAGARIVKANGLVAFPGLVHPYSRMSLGGRGGGSGVGSGSSNPHVLAYDEFSPAAEILSYVPRTGFTTVALYPVGATVSGQAVAIKPVGVTRDEMVIAKTAYLRIDMQANTAAKEQLRRDYEAAKKAIEAAKKPAQPTPPPAPPSSQQPPAPQPQPVPTPPAQPQPQPQKPDEKIETWVRHLKGELPAVAEVSTAAEFLHFRQVAKPFDEFKAPISFVLPLESYKAADPIGALKARVVLPPELTFLPYTRTRVNVAAELSRAGATVALIPSGDSLASFEGFLFRVAEIVKYGLDREAALRAITIVPAQVMGLDKRVGSLEAGKDADIVLLDGDPLAATTKIVKVLINGRMVFEP